MFKATTLPHIFFFFNDTATTEIYTLSLHDALPIFQRDAQQEARVEREGQEPPAACPELLHDPDGRPAAQRQAQQDRKSTRLNSSHSQISYAVFCLKKKRRRS